ncbi:ATP-binding protein [Bacillus sp. B1-b2]|uniref:ATP-binding protein n=1 Tax=Bacillus sp. B1-b2 TaxID=2653201 RepID=UPI001262A01A|nr:ATP-binding protein [Bacillus sp. B1-b2]KAB7668860.1 response regulator [Bacillus sp. B1-b2]
MRFSTKLYSGLGIIFVLVSILIILLMSMLKQQNNNMHILVHDLTQRMDASYTIKNEINEMSNNLKGLSTPLSATLLEMSKEEMEASRESINAAYTLIEEGNEKEEIKGLLIEFSTLYDTYEDQGQRLYEEGNSNINANFWISENEQKDRLLQIADSMYVIHKQEIEKDLNQTKNTYSMVVKMTYVYILMAVIASIIVAIYLIRNLTKNLNKIVTVMSSVSYKKGIKIPRLTITTKDEMGEISTAFNEMVSALESYSHKELETLGKLEEQAWLDSKLAEITGCISLVENIRSLADFCVSQLTSIVGGQYSAFYILKQENDTVFLEEVSSYAYYDKEKKKIPLGHGLVGQVAKENKSIIISEIPSGYLKIHSSIGAVEPKEIIIQPIAFEGKVLAVMELASLQYFRFIEQKLLSKVAQQIGISIHSLNNRLEVKRLLEDEQRLTEELQSQSEELQAQQQELLAINEELQSQYRVSEQKNAELKHIGKQLEEKAKQLESSSQYKSEFLANMSHELRTPLNSMLILSQVLVEKENEQLTPKQIQYLQTIYYSGNDLLRLINEILDLEKIETGKMEIIKTEVILENIQRSLLHQFTPIANQKKLDFFITIAKDVPESIDTDEYRLNQILKNLLSNAFKFTDKGRVDLSIEVSLESFIVFTVKDSGIGIPEDKVEIIFEPFQQADGTISRKYGGTGLGLSICKEITQLLDGQLHLSSIEGIGSSFVLSIPFNKRKRKEMNNKEALFQLETSNQQAAASVEEGLGHDPKEFTFAGKKILIIDDDIRNIFSLSAALEEYQMEVLFSENGKDGIKTLEDTPDIDLVLMDIMMPGMDGFEAISLIRKNSRFKSLPIIALTAKAMKHNREQCLAAGASDYISKPVNLDQLFSLIQVWLYKE